MTSKSTPLDIDLLEKIESVGGKIEKANLLAAMDERSRDLIKLALDPGITFGVTVPDEFEIKEHTHPCTRVEFWNAFEELALKLSRRDLTGNAAELAVNDLIFVLTPSLLDTKWAVRIINRQLRAGFDIRTFNEVFSGKDQVEKFACQLAEQYDPEDELKGTWIFEPKLDGNRVVIVDGVPTSRNGKTYGQLDHVIAEILSVDPKFFEKWVLDGEAMGTLGFDESSGALRRKKGDDPGTEFIFNCFDILSVEEWRARESKTPLSVRKGNILKHLPRTKHVAINPWVILVDPDHKAIMEMVGKHVSQGYEGTMGKLASAPYVFKRTKFNLKIKLFKDADLRIVGYYFGKGRNKDRLGGLILEGEVEGKQIVTKCGGGFSDLLRDEIVKEWEDWENGIAQTQYFEVTKKNSLRFPIFVMRRKDKEALKQR